MAAKSSDNVIKHFIDVGQIKTWSLLVTTLVDLSSDSSAVSGAQLSALFQMMSIKPEALRVALHRLSKEGWIISERTGRTSEYSLSSSGIVETLKVWDRAYNPDHGMALQWHTLIVPGG